MKALLMLPLLMVEVPARPVVRAVQRVTVSTQATQVHHLLRSLQKGTESPKDLSRRLQQSTRLAKKVLADQTFISVIKPGPVKSDDGKVFTLEGTSFIIPTVPEQRSCSAIQEDWQRLDKVYDMVNDLALELEEVYSHPEFCAPCADTVLTTLQETTEELESISTRLNQDGSRRVQIIWGPKAFLVDREQPRQDMRWESLIYYNIDGNSRAAGPQEALPVPDGLMIRPPLLQNGIQFQFETTAERACSPGLEIRFDGLIQTPAVRMQLILLSYPGKS
ncbi:hypothetical protein [Oligoflexus tunisiensis]|uniref:hypothetical protein n=1 Tax=Oligoflexus tunisiensis TaxID=708132 RepID=UPI00114CAF4F|nr:hypothetical protein [Oligoflexus tunisiensis]